MNNNYSPAGWYGSLSSFLELDQQTFFHSLVAHHESCMGMPPDRGQQVAWANCFDVLQSELPHLIQTYANIADWSIIFEYELPRERGRRPDVIILARNRIFILEFKDFPSSSQSYIDQASAYARDIANYHAASHDADVVPILVLTRAKEYNDNQDDVFINSPDILPQTISSYQSDESLPLIDVNNWLAADYAPLPSLVNAARRIFEHDPLPYIRRAHSAGIPETISLLVDVANKSQSDHEHHLALVTGVPGAGKTLVGIQFVYDNYFNDQGSHRTAVFLSGNGPLVKVLQHALGSSVFVQDVHGFLKQYGGNRPNAPDENVLVFDEAQRAWDSERVQLKRGHPLSEPQDFLSIGEKKFWSLLVGLIGDGQEIHLGEESGLIQWDHAISTAKKPWVVHCPQHVAGLFGSASKVFTSESLNLTASLRSHIAESVQLWVEQLLKGEILLASKTIGGVYSKNFDVYLSRDLDQAKNYVIERYEYQEEKRFGLLASSKAKNLERYGVNNSFQWTRNLRVGPWYNDPPHSPQSCCQLRELATEFACQGLELDFPIVCWGDDVVWSNERWATRPPGFRSQARDPHQLRINSYRVLLTRGRDGFIIYIPDDPKMNSTYDCLLGAGIRVLP